MREAAKPILMAVVGAPHGIKGEVRVKTFTGDPLALADYGSLHASDGRRFDVETIRPANTVVVVRFKQIRDRTAAEALNGTELFVNRSALPQPEEEDEFYQADLIGMTVLEGGEPVGTVTAIHDFGAGTILEIVYKGRQGTMLPFTQAAVPQIDLAGGTITVDAVAAGLVQDSDAGPAAEEGANEAAADQAGPRTPRRGRGEQS